MNREDIEVVLRGLGISTIGHTHDHVMTSCPLAKWTHQHGSDNSPSMGVLEQDGVSPVNCFACGYRGVLPSLVKDVNKYRKLDGQGNDELTEELLEFIKDAENKKVTVLPSFAEIEMPEQLIQNLNKYHPYMRERGIKEETAKKWLLGWYDFSESISGEQAENVARLLYPIISKRGDIKGFQCRRVDNTLDVPKYKNYPSGVNKSMYLYGEHLISPQYTKLLILESQNGTVMINQMLEEKGLTDMLALGLMGSKPSDAQVDKMVMWGKEVIICLDNDAAGRNGAADLLKRLRYRSCATSIIAYPPDSEGKDAEDLGETLLDILDRRMYYIEYQLRKSLRLID